MGKKKQADIIHSFDARLERLEGWTVLPVPFDVRKIYGTGAFVRVKGRIDGRPFSGISLMPLGGGQHFMPVNARLRKILRKEAGAKVSVVMKQDKSRIKLPVDLEDALANYPKAKIIFDAFSESHRKGYIEYLTEAKKVETRIQRIKKIIQQILEKESEE